MDLELRLDLPKGVIYPQAHQQPQTGFLSPKLSRETLHRRFETLAVGDTFWPGEETLTTTFRISGSKTSMSDPFCWFKTFKTVLLNILKEKYF